MPDRYKILLSRDIGVTVLGISGSASGYSGYSGVGTSGYSGVAGISGTSGATGAVGTSGYSGVVGTSGTSGATGAGTSGYSGVAGISGTSGATGAVGTSGYSGVVGTSGYSGLAGADAVAGKIPSAYAETTIAQTTTSGTLIDITNCTVTLNLDEAVEIAVFLNTEVTLSSGNSSLIGIAINVGGIDYDEVYAEVSEVITYLVLPIMHRTSELAPGNHTITGRFRRYSGTGTVGVLRSDLLAIAMQGAIGTSGYSGVAGISGTSGATGAVGTSGTSGATGAVGTSGYSGVAGTSGTSGTSGATGAVGTSGTSGATGAVGTSGYSGVAGTSGTSGATGAVGTSGYSGTSGTSGRSGATGTSGYSGISAVGKQAMWFPAQSMSFRSANLPAQMTLESTTNKVVRRVLAFDYAAIEYAQLPPLQMPSNWDEGTLTAKFTWECAAASGNVVWGITIRAIGDSDVIDAAAGTEVLVTDGVLASTDVMISAETGAIEPGGTQLENDILIVEIYRKATDAADTVNANDALLWGVTLYYTINAAVVA
jgi:hypothetical protein